MSHQIKNLQHWLGARKRYGPMVFAQHPLIKLGLKKTDLPYPRPERVDHAYSSVFGLAYPDTRFWAFHTEEQREVFLKEFPRGSKCDDPVSPEGDFW